MPKMVKLIAPAGTDECNYGTTRYRVHDDGTVTVPVEVAKDLVHGAGFALAPDQPAPEPTNEFSESGTATAKWWQIPE